MRLIPQLLRFCLPWACAGCRGALDSLEDTGFCGSCWLSIPRIQGLICFNCGIPLKEGGRTCFDCRQKPIPLLIRAAVEYQGVIRPAVHRFKYLGRKDLSRSLGALLSYAWSHYPEIQNVQGIVPVPLYRSHEKIRGFNQAELLAETLATQMRIRLLPLLVRNRPTRSQVTLNRLERQENVRSAFALQALDPEYLMYLRGKSFLLIDDVCTTGSTLQECAVVLRKAGAGPVKALVLARDL
jgi:ComF family protein